MCVCVCVCVCVYVYVCVRESERVRVFALNEDGDLLLPHGQLECGVFVRDYVCVYMYVCVHMYVHMYVQRRRKLTPAAWPDKNSQK